MNKRDIDEAALDFCEDQERQDEELQELRDKRAFKRNLTGASGPTSLKSQVLVSTG